MELKVTDVDYAPEELYGQVPFSIELIREIPGPDRPDYWIGKCKTSLKWINNNIEHRIGYFIVAARWEGTRIESGVSNLPIGISYIIDESVLNDKTLSFDKCEYVAVGISHEISGGKTIKERKGLNGGTIGKFFGTGNQ